MRRTRSAAPSAMIASGQSRTAWPTASRAAPSASPASITMPAAARDTPTKSAVRLMLVMCLLYIEGAGQDGPAPCVISMAGRYGSNPATPSRAAGVLGSG